MVYRYGFLIFFLYIKIFSDRLSVICLIKFAQFVSYVTRIAVMIKIVVSLFVVAIICVVFAAPTVPPEDHLQIEVLRFKNNNTLEKVGRYSFT